MKWQFLFFSILLCCQFNLLAQNANMGIPYLTNHLRSDYNAGTQNWAIAQDTMGVMYFGNNKGLLEFDGTNWKTYPLPNQTIVRSVSIDEEGLIYVGGQNEFGFFKPDSRGKLSFNSMKGLIPAEFSSFEDVWKILIREEQIFFCTERAIFVYEDAGIRVIEPITRFENYFQINGSIFFQDKERGLHSLDNFQLIHNIADDILENDRIVSIIDHKEDQQVVVTENLGLFLLNDKVLVPWEVSANAFIMKNRAFCALKLESGHIAIGSQQNGLVILEADGSIMLNINQDNGLNNNTVLYIKQDYQHNLWLALDNGIDYLEINSPFSKIQSNLGVDGTGYVSMVYQGKLYLGTNQGLFYKEWNNGENSFMNEKFKPVDNAQGQVWSLNPISNAVIVGQHSGASYLLGERTRSFSEIEGAWKFVQLALNPSFAIEGTYSGIYLYRNIQATNTSLYPEWRLVKKLEGFNESARVIEQDLEGNIWVSHAYKGLFKITLTQDLNEIESISFYSTENGLPSNLFVNIVLIKDEMLITTPSGIYKYDKEKDHFYAHDAFNEIFKDHQHIHRLVEDGLGNIWFSADDDFGIIRFDDNSVFQKLELEYFSQVHEDLVDGFEHVAAADDNNILIGAETGFIHYNPNVKRVLDFPNKILIREVVLMTDQDSIIYQGSSNNFDNQDLTFHNKKNDFRFSYSAPYYEKLNHMEYSYRLDGFDDDWSDWDVRSEKEYTNLSEGDYTFHVKARNAYREEGEGAIFSFTIDPPWFQTILAKTCFVVLGIFAMGIFVQTITKREKKKREELHKRQTQELERKEYEFKKEVEKSEGEIIKLNNEKLQIDLNHKNSQLASATMHLVQKSEMLSKLKNDLNNLLAKASTENRRKIQQLTRAIESDNLMDDNWERFEMYFDQVHENFFQRLRERYPKLTPKDQKLCAYLRMNLSTKEIAPLLNISVRGVEISRYRLRKKMDLKSEINLVEFMVSV